MNFRRALFFFLYMPFFSLLLGAFCGPSRPMNPYALQQQNACVENIKRGDYEAAKLRCDLCLEFDSSVPECLNGLGLVALAQSQQDVAIENFTKAIRNGKYFAQARNNLGVVYFRAEQFDKAIPSFIEALQIDPGYNDARYNYGLSLLRKGRHAMEKNNNTQAKSMFESAVLQYQKVTELNPYTKNAYRDLGVIMTFLSELSLQADKVKSYNSKAQNYFERCIELDSQDQACIESLGSLLKKQGKYREATLSASSCEGYYDLGMTYKEKLDTNNALLNCEKYLRCSSETSNADKKLKCGNLVEALKPDSAFKIRT